MKECLATKDRRERTRVSRITTFSQIYEQDQRDFVLYKLRNSLFSITVPILEELSLIKKMGVYHQELVETFNRTLQQGVTLCNRIWLTKLNKFNWLMADLSGKPCVKQINMDQALVLFENLISETIEHKDLNGLEEVICYIHNAVPYFSTRSDLFIKFYRYETYNAYAQQYAFTYVPTKTEEDIIKLNTDKLNDVTDILVRNTTKTVRVWLLRELYYMLSPLSCLSDTDKLLALKGLWTGKSDFFFDFISKADNDDNERGIRNFGCTNPHIYFGVHKAFNESLKLPKAARFNALLNVAHCNGTMSTKFINLSKNECMECRDENDFLNKLSEGYYCKDIKRMLCKDLNISPLLV